MPILYATYILLGRFITNEMESGPWEAREEDNSQLRTAALYGVIDACKRWNKPDYVNSMSTALSWPP